MSDNGIVSTAEPVVEIDAKQAEAIQRAQNEIARHDELIDGASLMLGSFEQMLELAQSAARVATPVEYRDMARQDVRALQDRITELGFKIDDWKDGKVKAQAKLDALK